MHNWKASPGKICMRTCNAEASASLKIPSCFRIINIGIGIAIGIGTGSGIDVCVGIGIGIGTGIGMA